MGYVPYVLGVAPFWAFGLVMYVRFVHGVSEFSQEWLDAAAIGCVYVLLCGTVALLAIRMLMHFGGTTYRH